MQNENNVKRYPFKFSPLMIGVFILALALCAAGIGLTTWRLIDFLKSDPTSIYGWIQHILLYLMCGLLALFVAAMLIRTQYIITDKQLITQFGIIKQKYDIKSIYSVHLFKGLNKLTVYFDDFQTKYIVIVVKEVWYDDFIKTLLERKPSIGLSFSSAEEEEDFKNQNKKK